ncbi:hypothetical protein [Streptacidiphilus sp. EB129]|uniref:hypothetical protein n=1 Tax=Streptacidiphilus sp. EB129 TaxID=3156262 RepID=UPI0035175B24
MATLLTEIEYARMVALEQSGQELPQLAWCELEPGHGGEWHYSDIDGVMDGNWWLRWHQDGGRELVLLQFCQVQDRAYPIPTPPGHDAAELEPCTLPEQHEGRHSFEFDVRVDAFGPRQPHLTAGDLRQILEEWDDDTPVRFAAAHAGVLADDAEVIPVATGSSWLHTLQRDGTAVMRGSVVVIVDRAVGPTQLNPQD